jgi:hypothetical protein
MVFISISTESPSLSGAKEAISVVKLGSGSKTEAVITVRRRLTISIAGAALPKVSASLS